MTPRSVYLHNNKLADAGLPDSMFNGSSNVEILILSSNFLRHVPKHLPPALYKLHLKVRRRENREGGEQTHSWSTRAGTCRRRAGPVGTALPSEAMGLWAHDGAHKSLWKSREVPGHLTFGVGYVGGC